MAAAARPSLLAAESLALLLVTLLLAALLLATLLLATSLLALLAALHATLLVPLAALLLAALALLALLAEATLLSVLTVVELSFSSSSTAIVSVHRYQGDVVSSCGVPGETQRFSRKVIHTVAGGSVSHKIG